MSRIGVLIAAAMALVSCSRDAGDANGKRRSEPAGNTVSATGVISAVEPDEVRVTTDDGRELALRLNDAVSVTLAGGQAEPAVITEGAPVRVSYRPKEGGGDLVTVDVEPKAASARGATKGAPQGDPPAHTEKASRGR